MQHGRSVSNISMATRLKSFSLRLTRAPLPKLHLPGKFLEGNEEEIVKQLKNGDLETLSREGVEIGVIPQRVKKSFDSLDHIVPPSLKVRYLLLHAYEQLEANPRLSGRWLELLANHGVSSHTISTMRLSCGTKYALGMSPVSTGTDYQVSPDTAEGAGDGSGVDEVVAVGKKRKHALGMSPVSTGTDYQVSPDTAEGAGDGSGVDEVVAVGKKRKHALGMSPVSTGTDYQVSPDAAEGAGDGSGVDEVVAVGKKRKKQPHDKCKYLLEKHVSGLTEILASNSSKWREIGVALNLPSNTLDEIMAMMHAQSGVTRINNVLREWIVGKHNHAKVPTIENLKEALQSSTVRLGDVASQLHEKLNEHGICLVNEEVAKKPCLEVSLLEIESQSRDTVVTQEKSTLLGVKVATRHETSVSYQWKRDGCLLQDGKEFLGVNKPVLCLSLASEGTYTCEIKLGSPMLVIHSEPIVLEVCCSISPFKSTLVDRYAAQPDIPANSWPPVSNNTYINLALIKQGNIEKAGEYARKTIQGNLDDVVANKESIEYETAFTDLEKGTRLLIEGRPGSGKTTLVHKFSQDWARKNNNKLNLQNIKLLFLVHLRGFFNDPNINLPTLLCKYYSSDSTISEIVQYAEKRNGEGLCFVLDGLDEYHPKSKNDTFIYQLIKKHLFPNSVVIIASRPAASAKLRQVATKQIEVVGFLREQIFEYVENYLFSKPSKKSGLHEYLKQHPNVQHMCYLPIHAAMVCFLYDVMGNTLPRTETEMYMQFTNHTLLRTFNREEEGSMDCLESVDDLPAQAKELYLKICQLGFKKTISSKQVMLKSEIKDFFKGINSDRESLGLITIDCMARKCGFEHLYTFLHLTFQEYLAAYHISILEEDQQVTIIEKYGRKKHMQVVWKFYCGLVSFSGKESKFQELMKSTQLKDDLFRIQCAFESQQSSTCDYVINSEENGTLSFSNHFLTPSDFTAIGYVMKSTTCAVEKLEFNKCKLGKEGISAFLEEAEDKVLLIRCLHFHVKGNVMEQYDCLNTLLKATTALEALDISSTNLGPKKVQALTSDVNLPCLRVLKISLELYRIQHGKEDKWLKLLQFNSTKFEQVVVDALPHYVFNYGTNTLVQAFGGAPFLRGLEYCNNLQALNICIDSDGLADGLKNCGNLQTLDLRDNHIDSESVKTLADGLKHCNKLHTLNLEDNNIDSDGAKALADGLKHCNNLHTLHLENNSIGSNGAKALSVGLKHCNNLSMLNLDGNGIGSDGTKALADSLKHCNNLHTLSLESNNIGSDGAKALSVSLKHCNNLRMLNLDGNGIGSDGTKALANSLKHCNNLHALNLEDNSIGSDGAKALADSLKHCNNLETLSLEGNSIGCDGARALSGGLKYCNDLWTLNLGDNSIGSDGAKALADGLKHCNNMRMLNLQHNGIGSDGAKALADGLKHCNNLETIHLEDNSIDSVGAKALANGLKHCNCTGLPLPKNRIVLTARMSCPMK